MKFKVQGSKFKVVRAGVWGVIKSGCGLSSWKWGQECPQNPQAGKPALRSADILVCGFGRLSSGLSLTHFCITPPPSSLRSKAGTMRLEEGARLCRKPAACLECTWKKQAHSIVKRSS